MDRKNTIKTLRYLIRVLNDSDIFNDADFERNYLDIVEASRVQLFIQQKLEL